MGEKAVSIASSFAVCRADDVLMGCCRVADMLPFCISISTASSTANL